MQKLEKMKLICLQYAAAAQWLITYSSDTPSTESPDVEKYKQLKLRTRSQKVASENATVLESILYVQTISHSSIISLSLSLLTYMICRKFEREFAIELKNLGPILSSSSRAEPYLTHLAQWLLGVGRD